MINLRKISQYHLPEKGRLSEVHLYFQLIILKKKSGHEQFKLNKEKNNHRINFNFL